MARKLKHGDTLTINGFLDHELDLRHSRQDLDREFGYKNTKGITTFRPKKIYIAQDLDLEDKQITLWHEIIEVFKYWCKFGWLREKKIDELAVGIHRTLRDTGLDSWDFE